MEKSKRITLVDDHSVVRSGLKELIEKLGPYSIVSEYDSGTSFLEDLPRESETDLILMDVSMPGMNGDELMERLKAIGFKIPVLILTLNESEELVLKLFRAGVRGYLTKTATAGEMKAALEQVFKTGFYHNDFLVFSLQNSTAPKVKSEQEQILERLTEKEKEFLKLVCNETEYTYDQIADQMQVSIRTVDGYRISLFDKFSLKSKTGLVLLVLKHRLIDYL